MKIYCEDELRNEIFNGEYGYLETGWISPLDIHFYFIGNGKDLSVHFVASSIEEIDSLIKSLEEIKNSFKEK